MPKQAVFAIIYEFILLFFVLIELKYTMKKLQTMQDVNKKTCAADCQIRVTWYLAYV